MPSSVKLGARNGAFAFRIVRLIKPEQIEGAQSGPLIEDELYQLSTARIVKLSDGTFSSANKCYFPDEDGRFANIVPCVDAAIFEVGGSSIRKKGARKFLDEIGVRQVGDAPTR